MAFDPSFEEQELHAETFRRHQLRMTPRELAAGVLVGAGFAIAVAVLLVVRPPHSFTLIPAVLCVLVLALATRVHFDTPAGFAVPTELAFVPLLFVIPAALVPVGVLLAWTIGRLPDLFTSDAPASRLLQLPGNSWYSVGPAAVFAVANVQPMNAGAALLVAALLAQFAVDFAVLAFEDAIATGTTVTAQLRETSWAYAIDAALAGIGLVVGRDLHSSPAAVLALVPLLGLLAIFARERHQRLHTLLELGSAYRGTALVLGDVLEADDGYTGEHCKSVVELTVAVAERLELGAEQRRNLEFAALLHDVGKIAIPKEIINKPGKLDPDEWRVIKTHTLEGQRMLSRVGGFMGEVGRIVRSHHERWDGGGYPDGLAGEAIPLEARIICCCDSWNAMRTDRVYRASLSYDAALAELTANSGTQFDPSIVAALIPIVEAAETGPRGPGPPVTATGGEKSVSLP